MIGKVQIQFPEKLSNCFSKWLCQLSILIRKVCSPNYFISLPIFDIVTVFEFSHSSECVLIFHCYFILHFIDENIEQSCNVLIGNSCMFFHGISIQIFCQFKNWQPLQFCVWVCVSLLSCKSSVYNLDTKLLSSICIANTFSLSVAFLYILLIVLFGKVVSNFYKSIKKFIFSAIVFYLENL